ncbi:MAG: LPS assembly protein LptD [Paracoccaceae bacterium]|nr:LPS assembly protein LptD [Paracoccaceae bacterium]
MTRVAMDGWSPRLSNWQDRLPPRTTRLSKELTSPVCAMLIGLAVALACPLLAPLASAQTPSEQPNSILLVAGRLEVQSESGVLIASDGVTIHYGDHVLRTDRIAYDQRAGQLSISEPLVLVSGTDIVAGQSAELSDDLRNGIIRGVQVLIDRQFQLAAEGIRRRDGRFTYLRNAVASSCRICRDNTVPVWQIRSEAVLHDLVAQRIYFRNAVLEVAGIPVLILPSLHIPDPSVTRASGFLVPTAITSSTLGTGFKLPYYHVLSPHDDMTLTPFVTTEGGAVIEAEYRRNAASGQFEFEGALNLGGGIDDKDYGNFISGSGQFDLPNEFLLDFELGLAANKNFIAQYGYGQQDRLLSRVDVERTRSDSHVGFGAAFIQSLRTREIDPKIPLVFPEISYRRTWRHASLPGTLGLRAHWVNLLREGDNSFARAGLHFDWRHRWPIGNGFIAGLTTEVAGIAYKTDDDPEFGSGSLAVPDGTVAIELRRPLRLTSTSGSLHRLEPIVQLVWRPDRLKPVPNEDSDEFEFEDSSLFSFDRFPGLDQRELGLRANVGVSYSVLAASGMSLDAVIGQVFRPRDLNQFPDGSALSGTSSDVVTALSLKLPNRLGLTSLAVFDDRLQVTKSEHRLNYNHDRFDLAIGFLDLKTAEMSGGKHRSRELIAKGTYRISPTADLFGSFRRNLADHQTTGAEVGFSIANDCVNFNFSFSLDAAVSGTVRSARTLSMTVELLGFGSTTDIRGRVGDTCVF